MPICLDTRVLVPVRLTDDEHLEPGAQACFFVRPLTVSQRLRIIEVLDRLADAIRANNTHDRLASLTEALELCVAKWNPPGSSPGSAPVELKDVKDLYEVMTFEELSQLVGLAMDAINLKETDLKKFVLPWESPTASSTVAEPPEAPPKLTPQEQSALNMP